MDLRNQNLEGINTRNNVFADRAKTSENMAMGDRQRNLRSSASPFKRDVFEPIHRTTF